MSAHRSERWLREAAGSILRQKLPGDWDLELLIGVDACPATLDAALKISDPRVVVVSMKKNVGTYQTLNTLLDHARGKLIAVMDSDDVSTPGRLASQVWALTSTAKYGLVAGHYQNCGLGMEPLGPPIPKICHGAMMVRRSLYDRLGGYKPWRCGADVDFFIRAEKLGAKSALVDSTFLLRRVHPSSLSHSESTGMRSALRASVMRLREQERRRSSPTVVNRVPAAHEVVRDPRGNPDVKTPVG